MTILEAPYELIESSIFLPSPAFGDSESPQLGLNKKYSMNNNVYTYVKRKNRSKLNYTFVLTFDKHFELQAFVNLYLTNYLKLTNHKNEVWKVRLTSEPLTYTYKTRDERAEILLTFEGIKINGSVTQC